MLLRSARLILMLLRFAFELYWLKRIKGHDPAAQARREQVYRSQAHHFRKVATSLGGLPIKVGQFLSTRVDVLPKPYTEELAKLQDEVTPVPFEQIREVLEAELGPLAKHFSQINPDPLGAASLAQVYEAILNDGTEVAVKVLRPKIHQQVQADLRALRILIWYLDRYSSLRRQMNFRLLYQEFLHTLSREMDLEAEADNLRRFRDNFKTHPRIYVPWVHDVLVSQRVLVMEKITGVKLTDLPGLQKLGADPRQLADLLLSSFIQQVVEDGFFHADPHPGNLLVDDQKRLVYLDFGMMGEIPPESRPIFRAGLGGILRNEPKTMVTALVDLGFVLPHADLRSIEKGVVMLLDAFAAGGMKGLSTNEAMRLMEEMSRFFLNQPIQVPANFTFLGRAVGIILGLLETLAPEINVVDLLKEAVSDNKTVQDEGIDFILAEAKEWLKAALGLPQAIQTIASSLAAGEIIEVDLAPITAELTQLSAKVSRLSWLVFFLGLILLALIIRLA